MTTKYQQVEMMELTDEMGKKWELKYYVWGMNASYGIKIERCSKEIETGQLGDASAKMSEETCGLTSSYEEAEKWVRSMADYTVTPFSLHAVVDDIMG